MRSLLSSAAVAVVVSVALTGCPKKGGDAGGDAGSDASIAAVDAGSAVKIANEADIKRYPTDETALDGDATVKAPSADARKSVPKGDVVASLKAGTNVTQVVDHNGYYLVTFDDPKDATRRLEGWVPKLAFATPKVAPKGAKVPKCAANEVLTFAMELGDPKCRRPCEDDNNCGAGQKCEVSNTGDDKGMLIPHGNALVCVFQGPVAPPPAKDAGASAGKLVAPGGNAISIPNPKHLPCPSGWVDTGTFATCQYQCDEDRKCPKGFCQAAGWCE